MARERTSLLVLPVLIVLLGCSGGSSVSAEKPKGKEKAKKKSEKASKKKHTNRLAKETSPYLLLHAHNPVDWYPWGAEAFAKAKKEKKLIFLSVGYSSCHWCHVMERESFMDKEIAALMNKNFVCIKVDREERPDVDAIYMASVQIMNSGRGGWPMSVFLTPDAKPFIGGTYFPARDNDRPGSRGFLTVLKQMQGFWTKQREAVIKQANEVTRLVKQQLDGRRPGLLTPITSAVLADAVDTLGKKFDPVYGGFRFRDENPRIPKFPEPSNLLFLINQVDTKTLDKGLLGQAKKQLLFTLDRMAIGGIRDHLGGGFHRYSVDRFWKIPHFEKMLYDNGQLASAYSEAYRISKKESYRQVVYEMLGFIQREMTSSEGGFYSALDAESEDEEGKFYRWSRAEVKKTLTTEQYNLFADIYGISDEPNFEKHYAPQLSKSMADMAKGRATKEAELEKQLEPIRKKLFDLRAKRPRPLTDTKILTSWNGLMIRGFADAGRIFKEKSFIKSAEKSAEFVLAKLRDKKGRLLRTYGKGKAKLNAYLNDYAFLADGFIALYRTTGEKKWLTRADEITQLQVKLFWDARRGGFYFTADDHESLLARGKNPVDGAQPSGNSVSAGNLVFLSQALKKPDYLKKAKETIDTFAAGMQTNPDMSPRMLIAFAQYLKVAPKKKPAKKK